jgi:Na+-translocating ferredoxin:NAD+ oxidoreductase RnfC subunit
MDVIQLKNIIYEYGIVGAGGAGFPTHEKLNLKVDTVILNCAECEPLLRVDRQMLAEYTENILQAVELVVDSLEAEQGIISIKSAYSNAISSVKTSIDRFSKLQLKILKDFYPAGDEMVLIYESTGRIVPEGALPITSGVMVINVETALNIYNAVFLKEPVIYKYVTVTGEVKSPVTVKVPIGTTIGELLDYAGGTTVTNYEIIMGGPMTGKLTTESSTVTKTTKAVLVLPKDHPVIKRRHQKLSMNIKRVMAACSQCQMCTDLCPRNLLGYSIKPHKIMRAFAGGISANIEAFTASMLCSECGLCETYSCHQSLSPKMIIGELKMKLRQKGIRNTTNKIIEKTSSNRDGRQVPIERLISRLALDKYNLDAPLSCDDKHIGTKVKIMLNQHIGVPAVSVVKLNDSVEKGSVIAETPQGKLGVKIHASISGKIIQIDSESITIGIRR